jgi:hypothetical protein
MPTVSAKINPKEYDVITHYANACGETISNLIRKVLICEATFLHGFIVFDIDRNSIASK